MVSSGSGQRFQWGLRQLTEMGAAKARCQGCPGGPDKLNASSFPCGLDAACLDLLMELSANKRQDNASRQGAGHQGANSERRGGAGHSSLE